jgi:hypothetical protein
MSEGQMEPENPIRQRLAEEDKVQQRIGTDGYTAALRVD